MENNQNSKKNIIVFSWYSSPFVGGAEIFVKEITKHLAQKYNFEIITGRYKKDLKPKEKFEGGTIYRVGIGHPLIDKIFYFFFALWQAIKIKKTKKISLIHGVIANPAGFTALVFHKISKIPFLLTEQSGNLVKDVKRSNPFNFYSIKEIYRGADFIHVISHSIRDTILALGKADENEKKIKVIPNGVSLSKFRGSKEKENNRIICVARLEKYKGIDYLIAAIPEILEKFPNAKLVLVGEGPEKEKLKIKSEKLKVGNKVEFKGAVPHEKIPEELAKSEVFVLPSISEGMGIAILEAQAAGIPVIGTKVGGILDLIEDQKTGILVEPKNPEQIAKAIRKIFSNPEFAKNLAKNAKKNLEKYDWENISKRIDKIYQKLLI